MEPNSQFDRDYHLVFLMEASCKRLKLSSPASPAWTLDAVVAEVKEGQRVVAIQRLPKGLRTSRQTASIFTPFMSNGPCWKSHLSFWAVDLPRNEQCVCDVNKELQGTASSSFQKSNETLPC